jgi:hypothetical protein
MIINFNSFEKIYENNIENKNDIKQIMEAEGFNIDEGILDSITGFFKNLFKGPEKKKIKAILSQLNSIESQYWDDWSELHIKLSKYQMVIDELGWNFATGEQKALIERTAKQIEQLEIKKQADMEMVEKAATALAKTDEMVKYLDMEFSKIKSEKAQIAYDKAKEKASPDILKKMHKEVKKEVDAARKKAGVAKEAMSGNAKDKTVNKVPMDKLIDEANYDEFVYYIRKNKLTGNEQWVRNLKTEIQRKLADTKKKAEKTSGSRRYEADEAIALLQGKVDFLKDLLFDIVSDKGTEKKSRRIKPPSSQIKIPTTKIKRS